MLHRHLSFVVCVCLASSLAAFGQSNQGTGYLFQYAGYPSTSGQFLGYVATGSLGATINANGPSGITQIIAEPNGSQFYLIGVGSTSSVQSVDPTFTKFNTINGLAAPPDAAAVTPDGKYLLVAADQFYVVSTATNTVVQTLKMDGTASYSSDETGWCVSCWIGVSHDSTTAYVLVNSSFGSEVDVYNLVTMTRSAAVPLTTPVGNSIPNATSISVSPLGAIYVTAYNYIVVVDPVALQITAALQLFEFLPYRLHFTPDGTTAYASNIGTPLAGESILQLTVSTNNVNYWPTRGSIGSPEIDDVYVGSDHQIFAYSSQYTTLYDVGANPFTAAPSTSIESASLPSAALVNVTGVAITNEVPSAQYLFLLVSSGNQSTLYRVTLSTNAVGQGPAPLAGNDLEYVVVPPETGAANILPVSVSTQSLTPGTSGVTSPPLIARVLNAAGQPVYDQATTFSADPSATGITINTPSPTTGSDGYVQTTVTVASGATCPNATCNITLTAGAASFTFVINLPSTSGAPGGGGTTSSQITIISGNGQVLNGGEGLLGGIVPIPLTVQITNGSGTPVPNVTVTFSVSGNGGLTETSAVTDANGYASPAACTSGNPPSDCVYFVPVPLTYGQSETDTVAASTTAYGTAYFTETFYEPALVQGEPQIWAQTTLLSPQVGTITIPEGSAYPTPIQAQMLINPSAITGGTSAPLVGFTITTTSDAGYPILSPPPAAYCTNTTPSTNSGIASCTLVATCPTGTLPQSFAIDILVGNYQYYTKQVLITGGSASLITIVSGNNQSGVAGQALKPLIATVTDGCGNPSPGIAVTWTITQGSATLTNTVNTSNSLGQVSAGVTLGQTAGSVTVRLSAAGLPNINFTLTNTVEVSSVTLQSGNNQTAMEGAAFPQPLTFLVKDNNGNPLSGVLVTFGVASGSATVNPSSATSSSQGLVSTTVTAGSVAGAVVITATAATFTASANLTVQPPGPSITSASFYNAASFQAGLVPCGLATVTGNGIAPNVTGVVSGSSGFGPLPYTLGGLSMTIGGVPVPLYSISNENGTQQATFQTPCETAAGSTTVVVTINNGTPTTIPGVPVYAAQPGIFTYAGPNNIQYGAVISAVDGSYVTPSNLAKAGGTYYLVATGLGQTNPRTTTNSAGIAGENVTAQIIVGVNNAGVPVISAQYLAGSIGVDIVEFQIPLNEAAGTNVPLALAAVINNGGQVVYGNPVFLPGIVIQ